MLDMKERPILTDQEVFESRAQTHVVPTRGVVYAEDQFCLAIVCLAIHLSARSHAVEGIVARLGKCGLSTKAMHKEMVYRVVQNVIGQLCDGKSRQAGYVLEGISCEVPSKGYHCRRGICTIQFRALGWHGSVVAEGLHTRPENAPEWI